MLSRLPFLLRIMIKRKFLFNFESIFLSFLIVIVFIPFSLCAQRNPTPPPQIMKIKLFLPVDKAPKTDRTVPRLAGVQVLVVVMVTAPRNKVKGSTWHVAQRYREIYEARGPLAVFVDTIRKSNNGMAHNFSTKKMYPVAMFGEIFANKIS